MNSHAHVPLRDTHGSHPPNVALITNNSVCACPTATVTSGVGRNTFPVGLANDTRVPHWLIETNAAYLDFPRPALPPVVYQPQPLSPGLQRIQARQPEALRRARELRAILGNPVEAMAQALADIPGDNETWDRIAQEPYG